VPMSRARDPHPAVNIADRERDLCVRAGERPGAASTPIPDDAPVTIARLPDKSTTAMTSAAVDLAAEWNGDSTSAQFV